MDHLLTLQNQKRLQPQSLQNAGMSLKQQRLVGCAEVRTKVGFLSFSIVLLFKLHNYFHQGFLCTIENKTVTSFDDRAVKSAANVPFLQSLCPAPLWQRLFTSSSKWQPGEALFAFCFQMTCYFNWCGLFQVNISLKSNSKEKNKEDLTLKHNECLF